jgi:hypothetical protein
MTRAILAVEIDWPECPRIAASSHISPDADADAEAICLR